MAREILEKQGAKGTVCCENFFAPPRTLIEQFDVVVSFGVLEHFEDTVGCVSAFSRFLKPGGIIITSVPNMRGILGLLQKKLNKQVYDKHVPLDADMLRGAHALSYFTDLKCDYFLSNDFGIINLGCLNPEQRSTRLKAFLMRNLSRASRAVWKIEEIIGNLPTSKLLSPFLICSGRITS
jgi:SAM-dependent methyltransferase